MINTNLFQSLNPFLTFLGNCEAAKYYATHNTEKSYTTCPYCNSLDTTIFMKFSSISPTIRCDKCGKLYNINEFPWSDDKIEVEYKSYIKYIVACNKHPYDKVRYLYDIHQP